MNERRMATRANGDDPYRIWGGFLALAVALALLAGCGGAAPTQTPPAPATATAQPASSTAPPATATFSATAAPPPIPTRAAAETPTGARPPATPRGAMNYPEPVRHAIALLASETNTAEDQIEVVSAERTDWSDSSLGCPQPGRAYLTVITPGYRAILKAGSTLYEYHTNEGTMAIRCPK